MLPLCLGCAALAACRSVAGTTRRSTRGGLPAFIAIVFAASLPLAVALPRTTRQESLQSPDALATEVESNLRATEATLQQVQKDVAKLDTFGEEVGLSIEVTGVDAVDARNVALVDALIQMDHIQGACTRRRAASPCRPFALPPAPTRARTLHNRSNAHNPPTFRKKPWTRPRAAPPRSR